MFDIATKRVKTLTRCEIFRPADTAPAAGASVAIQPPLFYVERTDLRKDIGFYADATRTTALLRVQPRPRIDPAARGLWSKAASLVAMKDTAYDVFQIDGTKLGEIHKMLGERQYRVCDAAGTQLMSAIQESEPVRARELVARLTMERPIADDRFAFWHDKRRVGWLEPDRHTRADSTLDMTLDEQRRVDRRLGLAVSCIDVLRQRNEE